MKRPSRSRRDGASKRSPGLQSPNSREAILDAALKAFAQGGFDGASLPRIAKMANVAPPLIHYHFGSKDKLWRETVDYSLGELRREAAAICSATRTLAPLDRLRALLQAITHFAARCPDHFAMIMAEARSDSDRFDWVRENYTGVLFADVVSILQDAKNASQIKDVAIDQLASMLVGGILVYFTVTPANANKRDVAKLADGYIDMMFVALVEGLATKPGSLVSSAARTRRSRSR
jgi:AcrR family transcriptional regulator